MRNLMLAAVSMAAFLSACGGGGGGGGSGTSLSLSASSLSFTAESSFVFPASSTPLPDAQNVTAAFVGDGLLVGYAPGVPEASWLSITDATAGNASPQAIALRPNTTYLTAGQYQTSVRFVTGRADGSDVKYRDVAVTYTVTPAFRASVSELELEKIRGYPDPVGTFNVAKGDSAWTATASEAWLNVGISQAANGGGTVTVTADYASLGNGTHTADVTVTETTGAQRQRLVPVTLVVREPSVTNDAPYDYYSFSALSDAAALPAAHTFNLVSEGPSEIAYTVSVAYTYGSSDWLQEIPDGTTPDVITLRPDTTALPPGESVAKVTFTPVTEGLRAHEVEVHYFVSPATLSKSQFKATYALTPAAAATEIDRVTSLTLSDNGVPLSWTAEYNAPWLDVLTPGGTTEAGSSTFQLALDEQALRAMSNGDYSTTVTVRYKSASMTEYRTETLPVELDLDLPRVRAIMPAYAELGQLQSHIIRGEGFNGIGTNGAELRIGGNVVTAYEKLSDTEIRLTAPSLTLGAHTVEVTNPQGLDRTATLTVVDTPAYGAFTTARTQMPGKVIYDPWRTAVYVGNHANTGYITTITRYRYNGSTWLSDTLVANSAMLDYTLSHDGEQLYVSVYNSGLHSVDLDAGTPELAFVDDLYLTRLEVLSDGRLFAIGGSDQPVIYDPENGAVQYTSYSNWLSNAAITASADGGTVAMSSPSSYTNFRLYRASTDQYQLLSRDTGGSQLVQSANRDGSRFVIGCYVYDSAGFELGYLGFYCSGNTLSPTSTLLYAPQQDSVGGENPRLTVIDTASAPVGGTFVEQTSYPLTAAPYDLWSSRTTVTPDGKAVLIAHRGAFQVFPLP